MFIIINNITFAENNIIYMNRIKDILKEKGKSQKDLAEQMGVSSQALGKQIAGKMLVETAERIATALDVPMWQLFASPGDVVKEITGGDRCPHCGQPIKIRIEKA